MIIKGLNRKNELIEIEINENIIQRVKKLDQSKKIGNEDYIIPGFIDIHTHGGYGTDFSDASEENTRKYLRKLAIEGTTSIVHATITTPKKNLKECLKIARKVMDNPREREARYLGINIEGNYLNPLKKGAHKVELFEPLTISEVDFLNEFNNIKMISFAIELAKPEVTRHIKNLGINPSAAHTMANGKDVIEHLNAGLIGATHTFNAMPVFNHRSDSIINRALTEDEIYTELISDGIHVHPNVVKLLYKIKPKDKILIITDSSPVKGMPDGDYKFGEIMVYKKDNLIRTKSDDSLAASLASMHECFIKFIKFTGCSIEEASIFTSTNQAKYLGINNLGEIKEQYLADILILDNSTLEIKKTISNGKITYEK